MEIYKSENASYPSSGNGSVFYEEDDPELVGKVEYTHIILVKEDGKCVMKVRLEEIVDVWLETLAPEKQSKLEQEEKERREKEKKEKEVRIAVAKKQSEEWEKKVKERNKKEDVIIPKVEKLLHEYYKLTPYERFGGTRRLEIGEHSLVICRGMNTRTGNYFHIAFTHFDIEDNHSFARCYQVDKSISSTGYGYGNDSIKISDLSNKEGRRRIAEFLMCINQFVPLA